MRWRECEVLIIDEISMVDGMYFDILDQVARRFRKVNQKELPFGGIQVILVGDFFQLPPVGLQKGTKFCFEAQCWSETIKRCIDLKQVFRQKDDVFVNLLNEVRLGSITDASVRLLEKCRTDSESAAVVVRSSEGSPPVKVEYTKLYSKNDAVDEMNNSRLNALGGPGEKVYRYICEDHSLSSDDRYLKAMQRDCRWKEVLELKKGAQVMLVTNYDPKAGLVNGTKGVVVRFSTSGDEKDLEECPVVLFSCNGTSKEVLIPRQQFKVEHGGKIMASRVQVTQSSSFSLSARA
jgi:ATP-dependent DNA helicase PIF1